MRIAVADVWVTLMAATMVFCYQKYSPPGNSSLVDLGNLEFEMATTLNGHWQRLDVSDTSTVGSFSSPIGMTFRLGFSSRN